MRLQVYIAHAGVCSRRKSLELIQSGAVAVNGQTITEPSFAVEADKDDIRVNGKKINLKEKLYLALHKPADYTTTKSDPHATKTIIDLLPPIYKHLNPVGRLDKDATGLLLLTNDGDLAFALTHPKFHVDKVYSVTVDKLISDQHVKLLEKGVNLKDGTTAPCAIKKTGSKNVVITIHEGRKRQVKRMFAHVGYRVTELKRIKMGTIELGNLPLGKWRILSQDEIMHLQQAVQR